MEKYRSNFRCELEYGEDILMNVYENDKLIYSERTTWFASHRNNSLGSELLKVIRKMQDSMDLNDVIEETENRLAKRSDGLGFFEKIRRCKLFRKKIDFKS